MTGFNVEQWIAFMEKAKFTNATDDATGTNLMSTAVPPDRIFIPLAVIISDTSSSANSVDIKKVEADGTKTDYHTNFNLAADETVVASMDEMSSLIPRLEGGTNLEFTAGVDGAEITMVYADNVGV